MKHTTKVLLTLAVIVGGIATIVYSSMSEAEFYKHVHEVLQDPERYENTTLKVHGFVEAGSIEEEIRDQNSYRTFILSYQGQRIRVNHSGTKPDTFRDLSEVVARGTIVKRDGEYMLDAVELMAKCPSKYEENQRSGAS